MRNLNCVLLNMLFLFVPMAALAGDLDSPAAPTEAASAMYTLEAIYNRLFDGTAGAKRSGAFTEPSGGPAPTGHTLDEVMDKAPSVDSTNGAGVANVLATKTFWGLKTGGWGLQIGTMPTNTLSAGSDTVAAGYYAATTLSTVDSDLTAPNIVSGKTIFGKAGTALAATGDAEAGDVLTGHTFSKTGAAGVSGTMTNNGAGSTITPGTSDQTLAAGYWSSANTVSGDTDLAAPNIKKDVDILGVTGTYEGGSAYPAPVPKTGQTTSAVDYDDGYYEKGVSWPSPRWTCYDNDPAEVDCSTGSPLTAVDNLTGLQWTINADLNGMKAWATAVSYCTGLTHGSYNDWRLPNRFELESLLDMSQSNPALPSGHPFTSVQSYYYWSSTTYADYTDFAWYVRLYFGFVNPVNKTSSYYVWPVRAGQ